MTEELTQPTYQTLDEIRLRKAQLQAQLAKDSNKLQGMWNGLFHTPKSQARPTSRISTMMKTGAGVFDIALLSWKLYRRFGGRKVQKKSRFSLFKR